MSVASSGIEPATLRLVAQCLNELRQGIKENLKLDRKKYFEITAGKKFRITGRLVNRLLQFTSSRQSTFQRIVSACYVILHVEPVYKSTSSNFFIYRCRLSKWKLFKPLMYWKIKLAYSSTKLLTFPSCEVLILIYIYGKVKIDREFY
jgi:hypothetical protein